MTPPDRPQDRIQEPRTEPKPEPRLAPKAEPETEPRTNPETRQQISGLEQDMAEKLTETPAGDGQQEIISRYRKVLAVDLKIDELKKEDIPKIQAQISNYRQLLGQSPPEEIRHQSRILIPKKDKESNMEIVDGLKSETAKRLLAYTCEFEEGAQNGEITDEKDSWKNKWFTLNYSRIGEDHLMKIGLGEILLDIDIKEILIDRNGEIIAAHRGIAKSPPKHEGRIGFIDNNGAYIPTLDGHRFKILSSKGANIENPTQISSYIQSYKEEERIRGNQNITHKSQVPDKDSEPQSETPSSDWGKRLRKIWPENRVPERYWFRYSDGGDRGQSFGRFQFFRDTFTKFMEYVREKAPHLWDSLSQTVKTKIMTQTEQFKIKPRGYRFSQEEKNRFFLNETEANELLSKVFKSSGLDYEFRGILLQQNIIPSILKLGDEIPAYRDTIRQLVNDDRYLAGVYDISNNCGSGGAKKVLRTAFQILANMKINPPNLEEMYTAMTQASISEYSKQRGLRTIGALAMILNHTGGSMDKRSMESLITRFIAAKSFNDKKAIISQIVQGNFQRS